MSHTTPSTPWWDDETARSAALRDSARRRLAQVDADHVRRSVLANLPSRSPARGFLAFLRPLPRPALVAASLAAVIVLFATGAGLGLWLTPSDHETAPAHVAATAPAESPADAAFTPRDELPPSAAEVNDIDSYDATAIVAAGGAHGPTVIWVFEQ